ncbi:hypothetical protein BDN70DRAFT_905618 [Pholiota conissans]|uniref:Btz domain-containing protein n=1 Tax=Pholiota conissans TaxID=109636 RepID=A0A9P5Z3D2_9AGAR|nr:hypothetical protein BDN70DRAFT_905618 [Pholiota conissans]
MPTAVNTPSPTRPVSKASTTKPRAGAASPKKRRVIRRRGRTRGDLDSDDEIEREAATDSESDDDELSSLDSATDDSDTEPVSEDVIPRDRTHLPTPRNSKSPETVVKEETGRVNGVSDSFFAPSRNWSEMVTDEKANGPSDLPVIDFEDFSGQPAPKKAPARKAKKAAKPNQASVSRAIPAAPAVPVSEEKSSSVSDEPVVEFPTESKPAASHPARTPGQSARQAYQHKLETDPSFVPTIGNFWGHDDRLIDTELRSLSGWWRGRGRGRGRGFGMRGRGGAYPPLPRNVPEGEDPAQPKEVEVPPIERAWTHDGFEELKRKEEHRRAEYQAARNNQASPKRGGFGAGRGGFVPGRGRGGFMRGGYASSSPRNGTQFGRIRFAMKPELMWTKQHEAFLYFDPALKPRHGQEQGFRVRIPGHPGQVIRATSAHREPSHAITSEALSEESTVELNFIVRLPTGAGKEQEKAAEKAAEETPIEEVFTVRPELAPKPPTSALEPTQVQLPVSLAAVVPVLPEPTIRSQLEQLTLEPQPADPERLALTEQAVLRQPAQEAPAEETQPAERPALPALQTTFSPPPPPQPLVQPAPIYGSPYGFHPALPPGLAMDQNGMPYEVATGRPVYLQTPVMFNPRPVMPPPYNPGMQFVPGHMHHASAVSPDFLSHSASHTPPMNGFIDPATGAPIFSFPRQTRIEIRAPTEESERAAKSSARTYSGLRTTAPSFQPSRHVSNPSNGYYQQPPPEDNGHGMTEDASQAGMPGMMPYPSYQQTYYYPEPYGYPQPQYMDMSQGGQYDVYNMDQPPQGTVYY